MYFYNSLAFLDVGLIPGSCPILEVLLVLGIEPRASHMLSTSSTAGYSFSPWIWDFVLNCVVY